LGSGRSNGGGSLGQSLGLCGKTLAEIDLSRTDISSLPDALGNQDYLYKHV
jgi:hypothetical protein